MKYLIGLIALILVAGGIYAAAQNAPIASTAEEESIAAAPEDAAIPADGTYRVIAEESRVNWAGQKPLLEGYINTGSIAVSEGHIIITGVQATGEFTLDLETLSVSATPTKPGQENALESHLMGERWFNVAEYPTATFAIESVAPLGDEPHAYEVSGSLTLKGQTHPVSFPATIYQRMDGFLHAEGELEIDRTVWGITAGSASFAENLADNAVGDMVALSFSLVAAPIE